MIRIQSESGRTLRLISTENTGLVYYTQDFGFVSERALKKRQDLRSREGRRETKKSPLFLIRTTAEQGAVVMESSGHCQLERVQDVQWKLKSSAGAFVLDWIDQKPDFSATQNPRLLKKKTQKVDRILFLPIFLSLVCILFMTLRFWQGEELIKSVSENTPVPPVVVVRAVKPEPPPPVQPKPLEQPKIQHQAVDKEVVAQKALTQNLGFLKLMGRQDLKKAMGGLPTSVPDAAGAGPGGKEGSGGQLLVGIGQGLRKTTVGNSGMAGLGGIGTKGAGGGLGGYGETDYGSGAGRTVSAMPLSQDAVMEGGLDRSAISATIMRYLSQVRACYEEGLKRKADLLGQVTMSFEISGTGSVNYSHVQRSSLGDREIESCISSRMLTWKFPVPRGNVNVKVSYPFMLRPVKS